MAALAGATVSPMIAAVKTMTDTITAPSRFIRSMRNTSRCTCVDDFRHGCCRAGRQPRRPPGPGRRPRTRPAPDSSGADRRSGRVEAFAGALVVREISDHLDGAERGSVADGRGESAVPGLAVEQGAFLRVAHRGVHAG